MRLSKKNLSLIIWVFLVALIVSMPFLVSESRLKIIGKCLSLSILALGIDLNWGFTGLLSLGQGIFFALGGYAIAMYLNLNSAIDGLPEFFGLYGVKELPFFWEPFKSPVFTLFAIWFIPGLVAGLLGYLVFRNRIKGVYFSILTQAALLVFYNFFNGQQKLINGTNGLSTPTTKLFGIMVGSPIMQNYFFYLTVILLVLSYFFCKWLVSKRFGSILIGIRDDEPRVRFSGYNPVLYKTIIFTIAGCLAGISGALYTVQADLITPQRMTIPFSIEMVIWVAVGGRGTLLGAVIGAFFIRMGESIVQGFLPGGWVFVQGALFILVVTVLPEGIIGWVKNDGPRNLLTRIGIARFIPTYPSLEANKNNDI